MALSNAVEKVLFLRPLQDFMDSSMKIGAVNVFKDDGETIKLAVNNNCSRTTKDIDTTHYLVRDGCDAGKVRVVYIRTEDQHAGLFLSR